MRTRFHPDELAVARTHPDIDNVNDGDPGEPGDPDNHEDEDKDDGGSVVTRHN